MQIRHTAALAALICAISPTRADISLIPGDAINLGHLVAVKETKNPRCIVIGDSLGVALAELLPCDANARVGRTTKQLAKGAHKTYPQRVVVISTGGNDKPAQKADFDTLRRHISRRALWILPAKNDAARQLISEIAEREGDDVVDAAAHGARDGIHPSHKGYLRLAKEITQAMAAKKIKPAVAVEPANAAPETTPGETPADHEESTPTADSGEAQ